MRLQSSQRYISRELTHFIGRGLDPDSQYSLLLKIINTGWLTHAPHRPEVSGNLSVNPSARLSENDMYLPQIICFCDIPFTDMAIHMQKYSSFGIAFDKSFIASLGGSPVYYIPKNAKANLRNLYAREIGPVDSAIPRSEYFDHMIQVYHKLFPYLYTLLSKEDNPIKSNENSRMLEDLERFLDFHIFSYLKFFDESLSDDHEENYYLEREWRVLGNINFSMEKDVKRIIIPGNYAKRFRDDCSKYCGELVFVE